jgi:uncharacterized protein YjiS (DUF1127 family)
VSTVALSRNLSRTMAGIGAVVAVGNPIWRLISRLRKTGRDARMLKTLPDHVLADIGLEKIEIRGTDGGRQVWVIPHRYC